jgi:hypothetical protein
VGSTVAVAIARTFLPMTRVHPSQRLS